MKPRKRRLTNAQRCRRYRERRKAALVKALGGKCAKCGSTRKLEFNHLQPRTWIARNVWASTRLRIYAEEAAAGKINLLCRTCNAKAGVPADPAIDRDPEWGLPEYRIA